MMKLKGETGFMYLFKSVDMRATGGIIPWSFYHGREQRAVPIR